MFSNVQKFYVKYTCDPKLGLFSEAGLLWFMWKDFILLLVFFIENHSEGIQIVWKYSITHLEIIVLASYLTNCVILDHLPLT